MIQSVSFLSLLLSLIENAELVYRVKQKFSGETIRSSAYNLPPAMFIIKGKDNNVTISGFAADTIQILATALQIEFKYVIPPDAEIKMYGQSQALINLLLKNETDIVPFMFRQTPERTAYMDFTPVVLTQSFKMLVPWPEAKSQFFAVFRPFGKEVWYWTLVSTFMLAIILTVEARYTKTNLTVNQKTNPSLTNDFGRNLIFIISVLTNHGTHYPFLNRFLVMIFSIGMWDLVMTIWTNSYTSTLTSALTVPILNSIPHTLEELANRNDMKLTMEEHYLLTDSILNSTSETYKKLGDEFRKNPRLLVKTSEEALQNVIKYGDAYAGTPAMILYFTSKDFAQTKKCRFMVSNPIGYNLFFSFGLQKNGFYNQIINRKMMHIFESGLMDHVGHMYVSEYNPCYNKIKKTVDRKPLKLQSLGGAFVVLFGGIFIAFFTFIGERVVHKNRTPA